MLPPKTFQAHRERASSRLPRTVSRQRYPKRATSTLRREAEFEGLLRCLFALPVPYRVDRARNVFSVLVALSCCNLWNIEQRQVPYRTSRREIRPTPSNEEDLQAAAGQTTLLFLRLITQKRRIANPLQVPSKIHSVNSTQTRFGKFYKGICVCTHVIPFSEH